MCQFYFTHIAIHTHGGTKTLQKYTSTEGSLSLTHSLCLSLIVSFAGLLSLSAFSFAVSLSLSLFVSVLRLSLSLSHSLRSSQCKVFKQRFWMRGWGGPSPKATTLWANTRGIRKFATHKRFCKGRSVGSLTDAYVDGSGKRRFKGNARLKTSQP